MGRIPEIEHMLNVMFEDRAYHVNVVNYDDISNNPVEKIFHVIETSYAAVDTLCIYANRKVNIGGVFKEINSSEKMNFGCVKLKFEHATCKLEVYGTVYYCTFATLTVSCCGGITMRVIAENIRNYFSDGNAENLAAMRKISSNINSHRQVVDAAKLQYFCEHSNRDSTRIFATPSGTYPGSAFYASIVYHVINKRLGPIPAIEDVIGNARIDLNEFLTRLHNLPAYVSYTGSIYDIISAFNALRKWYRE